MRLTARDPLGFVPASFDRISRAIAVFLVILLPLTAAAASRTDYSYSLLDSNLVYVRSEPSSVDISPQRMLLVARDNRTESLVNVATASFGIELVIRALPGNLSGSGAQFALFLSSPYDSRAAYLVLEGLSGLVLLEATNQTGDLLSRQAVGTFSSGDPLNVSVLFTPGSPFEFVVEQAGGTVTATMGYPMLANTVPVNLNVRLRTANGPQVISLTELMIRLPSDTNRHYLASSPLLLIQYFLISTFSVIGFRKQVWEYVRRARSSGTRDRTMRSWTVGTKIGLVAITAASLPVQVGLMTLGFHPNELFTQSLWSYLIPYYGGSAVYPISLSVPASGQAGFDSVIGAGFPYPPLPLYFYAIIGFVSTLVDPRFAVPSTVVWYAAKSLWLILLWVAGIVVFTEMIRSGVCRWGAFLAYVAVILAPALVLESLVLGQFSIAVALFIVLSVVAVRREQWTAACVFILLAILSKQSALLVAAFVLPAILIRAGPRIGLKALGQSLVAVFFILLPWFLAGISPAFVADVSVGSIPLNAIMVTPVSTPPWLKVVSIFDYNVWPLLTALLNSQHGVERFLFPDYLPQQILGLSYGQFGLVMAGAALALIATELVRSRKSARFVDEFAMVTLLTFLVLFEVMTRLSGRYITYALPAALLICVSTRTGRFGVVLFLAYSFVAALTMLAFLGISAAFAPGWLDAFLPFALLTTNDGLLTSLALAQLGTIAFLVIGCIQIASGRTLWGTKTYSKRPDVGRLPPAPMVSVIVLNYNGGPLLRRCVESILRSDYKNYEVVIVDNASRDGSIEGLSDLVSAGRVRLVLNDRNVLYARGNNAAVPHTSGDLLFFVNNDTELPAETLGEMVAAFQADAELGAAQPLILPAEGETESAAFGISLDTLGFHQVLVRDENPVAESTLPLSYVSGSALMIRRELFKIASGFDPLLDLYHNDADLSWKVWLVGFRVGTVWNARIRHWEGATASSIPAGDRLQSFVYSQLVLVSKNYESFHAILVGTALCSLYSVLSVLYAARGNRRFAGSILRGIGRFLLTTPTIRSTRRDSQRSRHYSDHEVCPRFLSGFNPIEVFRRKRLGWGYRSDQTITRLV